jgi:branched-chain amino acid transport system ATP-binding protein
MSLLEVRGVTISFGGLVANDAVTLDVGAGEVVGLVGPNGAGKTTLFNALCGLVDPEDGTIVFDGHNLTTWPPHRRSAAGIARTFQRLEVFAHLTVLENLMLPHEVHFSRTGLWQDVLAMPSRRRAEADARQRAVEIASIVEVGAYLDRNAGQLPLGINRRVELGRALASRPRLVLLDEPTSGMDTAETTHMADVLRGVARDEDLAILLVEHDVAFVMSLCSRIYVLDFGRLIASGTPAEIRRNRDVRRAYLGADDAASA